MICFVGIARDTHHLRIIIISPPYSSLCRYLQRHMDLNLPVILHHFMASCYFDIICNVAVALNTLIIFQHDGTILTTWTLFITLGLSILAHKLSLLQQSSSLCVLRLLVKILVNI